MQLSEQQKAAVEHVGSPALVVAGAGSGKTRTLTAKIAYLIAEGFDPGRILAITFTNKAAGEMKSRLLAMTSLLPQNFPWVRTYHSACLQILKSACHLLGYSLPLQIYSDYQQRKLVSEILIELNIDKKFAAAVLNRISNAKNSGDPSRYFQVMPAVSFVDLTAVYEKYEKRLKERNAVDFDNILFLTRDLLRDFPEIRKQYQDLFQFVLVDEYQDSNNLQEELTRLLLGHDNLFCVGDDWQAIYGFRGSNVSHFLTFESNYPKSKVFRLEENYRSSDEIVQVANNLIVHNEHRMEKKCFSAKRGGVVETHSFFNENEEADWVAEKVLSLRDMGIAFDRMAVLYRTKFCSRAFEKAFRFMRIPYRMVGSKGFFERMEILDLNCYLSAAVFPKDDVAFERILNTPRRGIGPKMIEKIGSVRSGDMSLQAAAQKVVEDRIVTPKVHAALSDLIGLLDEIRRLPPGRAVEQVIQGSGYLDYLRGSSKTEGDYTTRLENIEELIYTASQKPTIVEYLEEAALIREDTEEEQEDVQGVNLSTVHASKGLEYYATFVAGCEEGLFPHWKSKETDAELQEERRLMYVAVTRAEQLLFISRADYRRGQPAVESRFYSEIEASLQG